MGSKVGVGAALGTTDGGQGACGREWRGVGSKVGSWSRAGNYRWWEGWKETPLNHDASLSPPSRPVQFPVRLQLPTLLRTPTALSLHPAHRMQFPARFKLPPNCPPYGALPPSRLLQTLSGVEGSAVLGSPAGGKDGAASDGNNR